VIAVYVSGHGFGHATRVGEVLRAVRQREPTILLSIVSSTPRALFRSALGDSFVHRGVACDVGLAQQGALDIDLDLTAAHLGAFEAGFGALVSQEAAWLRSAGASLVVGDIPPLASAAAAEAGLPSVALGNFSWDWIYRHFAKGRAPFGAAAETAARAYAKTSLLLVLPFAGDLSAFPRRRSIPLVARKPAIDREDVRRRLALGPFVLWSFGGMGLPGFDFSLLARSAFRYVSVGEGGSHKTVSMISSATLEKAGVGYADLVGAADAVVTKPGYGIVSDAIGGGTRILFTDRGDFPEYPILVREMAPLLPTRHISRADLLAGRIDAALAALLTSPVRDPPDLRGAAVAAQAILEFS
jgi:hypothetical protein